MTGGEDGVVAVWRSNNNSVRLQLQRALCAHTQAVTSLSVCQSYSLVVSASNDRSIIFWDLTSLEYVRQLPELPGPATAIHTNDMTGEVVTAVGATLTVWSINGDCLAAVNTSQDSLDVILSITSPLISDWTEAGWYLTGHQSGAIRLWRMKFDTHSSTNRKASSTQLKSGNPFLTPVKNRSRATNSALAAPSGLRRLGSGVESVDSDLKTCITGGTPEFHLVLCKVLLWHKDPVTALSLGSELKQLCSGDSGGHVVSWTLPDDISKNSNPPLVVHAVSFIYLTYIFSIGCLSSSYLVIFLPLQVLLLLHLIKVPTSIPANFFQILELIHGPCLHAVGCLQLLSNTGYIRREEASLQKLRSCSLYQLC